MFDFKSLPVIFGSVGSARAINLHVSSKSKPSGSLCSSTWHPLSSSSLSDDGITYDGEHPIGNDPNDGTALAIAFDPDDGSESYASNIELYIN